MAGRGRGRGRGVSFDLESLGFVKGEALPPPTAQPPAAFPPLEFKPVPLLTGEEHDYLLALKQELRGTFRDSVFFVQPVTIKKDIERYSDKYQQVPAGEQIKWDWSLFPKELHQKTKQRRQGSKKVLPIVKKTALLEPDIDNKLKQLEAVEETAESDEEPQKEKNKDEEEGEVEEEELYDEEEHEEGTDYAFNYFDNGETYLDEEDDNLDDGPVY